LPDCVLAVTLWSQGDASPAVLLGCAVMPLFSKKGRLKCGLQTLTLCRCAMPDLRWPSRTPGKVPVAQRGRQGELDRKLKQLSRGELPRCAWLDGKTLKAVQQLGASLAPVSILVIGLCCAALGCSAHCHQNLEQSSSAHCSSCDLLTVRF
jgi:hypothetical protein